MRRYRGQRMDTQEWAYGCLVEGGELFRSPYREDLPFSNSFIISETKPPYIDGSFGGEKWRLVAHAIHVIPETVGQETGVLDKNWRMVFEHDFVRYMWCKEPVIMKVVYVNGEFLMCPIGNYQFAVWAIRIAGESDCIEVVGNEFEGVTA